MVIVPWAGWNGIYLQFLSYADDKYRELHIFHYRVSVSKIRKIIYRSDVQVTFELYGHFICYRLFIPNKAKFEKYCLTEWIPKIHDGITMTLVCTYTCLVKFGSDTLAKVNQ